MFALLMVFVSRVPSSSTKIYTNTPGTKEAMRPRAKSTMSLCARVGCLVVSKMRIRFPANKMPKRNLIDIEKLKNLEIQSNYVCKIANRFGLLHDEVTSTEDEWTQLKEAVVMSATEVCGTKK